MKNICENRIYIGGNPKDILSFRDYCGENFDFNRILPSPEEFSNKEKVTPNNILTIIDTKSNLFHSFNGKHVTPNSLKEAKEMYKKAVSITEAFKMGYSPCLECINDTGNIDFSKGVCMDISIKESIRRIELYGVDNYIDWRRNNWGTIEEPFDVKFKWMPCRAYIEFNTILTPPFKLFHYILQKFINLSITWEYKRFDQHRFKNILTLRDTCQGRR